MQARLSEQERSVQYNPAFVEYRNILSDAEKERLHGFAAKFSLARFKEDARNYEETMVDFVYTSAKIEGNTYDRIDTDNLLRLGVTAGGKKYSDALMLINLRNGFERVMLTESTTKLDHDYLCNLHKVVMRDLLPAHEQGIVRTSAVNIGASTYDPPADAGRLRTEIRFILPEAEKYDDPFERAIYLHCNLAYLQYFRDGNKRTSRLMQTAALVQGGKLPMLFNDALIESYKRATVNYYETGSYAPYVKFFKDSYEITVDKMLGEPSPKLSAYEAEEFQRRVAYLPKLEKDAGAAYTFWLLAKEAMDAAGSPESVNWPDVERRAIVASIAEHGQEPKEVASVICRHSPGVTSNEKRQAILQDIDWLAADLQMQFAKKQVGSDMTPTRGARSKSTGPQAWKASSPRRPARS